MKKVKTTQKLPMTGKVKKGFKLYAGIIASITVLAVFGVIAFAADDPVGVVNNLSTFIFGLIRAVEDEKPGLSSRIRAIMSLTAFLESWAPSLPAETP